MLSDMMTDVGQRLSGYPSSFGLSAARPGFGMPTGIMPPPGMPPGMPPSAPMPNPGQPNMPQGMPSGAMPPPGAGGPVGGPIMPAAHLNGPQVTGMPPPQGGAPMMQRPTGIMPTASGSQPGFGQQPSMMPQNGLAAARWGMSPWQQGGGYWGGGAQMRPWQQAGGWGGGMRPWQSGGWGGRAAAGPWSGGMYGSGSQG